MPWKNLNNKSSDEILWDGLFSLYVDSEVSYEPLTVLPTDAALGLGQK